MNKIKLRELIGALMMNPTMAEKPVTASFLTRVIEAILEQDKIQCPHDWSQGTSGLWCKKCNQYKI